jgi:predicted RNase H-like HicB family nuclease
MHLELTAVFKRVTDGYIGFVEELPGANTEGRTLDETRENLVEAVQLVLEANRSLSKRDLKDGEIIRETLRISYP